MASRRNSDVRGEAVQARDRCGLVSGELAATDPLAESAHHEGHLLERQRPHRSRVRDPGRVAVRRLRIVSAARRPRPAAGRGPPIAAPGSARCPRIARHARSPGAPDRSCPANRSPRCTRRPSRAPCRCGAGRGSSPSDGEIARGGSATCSLRGARRCVAGPAMVCRSKCRPTRPPRRAPCAIASAARHAPRSTAATRAREARDPGDRPAACTGFAGLAAGPAARAPRNRGHLLPRRQRRARADLSGRHLARSDLSFGGEWLGLRPVNCGTHRYYGVGLEHVAFEVDIEDDVDAAHQRCVRRGIGSIIGPSTTTTSRALTRSSSSIRTDRASRCSRDGRAARRGAARRPTTASALAP
jgi:hypothetical protein